MHLGISSLQFLIAMVQHFHPSCINFSNRMECRQYAHRPRNLWHIAGLESEVQLLHDIIATYTVVFISFLHVYDTERSTHT